MPAPAAAAVFPAPIGWNIPLGTSFQESGPPPATGIANTIDRESLTQQLEMEGIRINQINWAQKEIVRRKAQEQKDLIDQQAEAALSNLDHKRNEQVIGLHAAVFNQRSHIEQE